MGEALHATATRGRRRRRGPPGARVLPVLLLGLGCAAQVAAVGPGFVHRSRGYAVGSPGSGWERVTLDGADLAFRRGRESLSLQSRCGRPVADAEVMARHLWIGTRQRRPLASGPVEIDGRQAWSLTFDAVDGAAAVRVKSVTLVEGGCTFDFVLVGDAGAAGSEPAFDDWWSSFRLGAGAAVGAGGAP